jgi:hypothetical protein
LHRLVMELTIHGAVPWQRAAIVRGACEISNLKSEITDRRAGG